MGRDTLNPLPWCHEMGAYYWQISYHYCIYNPQWRKWQKPLEMQDIIPVIDGLIEGVKQGLTWAETQ